MIAERVIGCVSCGKPAALVGDQVPGLDIPGHGTGFECFWCLALRRPGASELFLRDRIPNVFDVDAALRCLGAFTFGLRGITIGEFARRDFEDADMVVPP